MVWKTFAGITFLKVCMHFSSLVGYGISSMNAEVISSFFRITMEGEDIVKNSLEVAYFTRETHVLNCALSCMREQSCMVSSFGQDVRTCILYRKKKNSSQELEDSRFRNPEFTHFKKLGEFDPEKRRFMNPDDLQKPESAIFEPSSCAEIKSKTNGIYSIKLSDNRFVQVYCIMENIRGCEAGGWALAMKINGYKSTFTFESRYWINTRTLNYPAHMATLDDKEMKSPIFWQMKARKICVGMKRANDTNWLQIQLNANSLRSLFASNIYFGTELGKSSWKSLLKGSSLVDACTSEGVNLSTGKRGYVLMMRIGMIGSSFPCDTPNSFIGFGANIIASSGNVIVGQIETKTFGYILVK